MADDVPAWLSDPEREKLRDLLGAEQEATRAQIAALAEDFNAIVESSAMTALDDEHDPDGSTIGFERAQVAALLRRARSRLVDLDQAQDRLRVGVYGVCARCGQSIALERLMAHPAAKTCFDCARRTGTAADNVD